ncbi:hypothetical protein FRC10_004204, partial [Ceratobasidium sp. 414]
TLPEHGDMLVQISEATWPDLVDFVKTAEITIGHIVEVDHVPLSPLAEKAKATRGVPPYNKLLRAASNPVGNTPRLKASRFPVAIRATFQTLRLYNVHSSSSIGSLVKHIEKRYGPLAAFQKFSLLGERLDDEAILDQSGITAGTTLDLVLSTRKSMIYCIAPRHDTLEKFALTGVKVTIMVNRGWELVALAPPEDLEYKDLLMYTSWIVDVASDGTLWDPASQKELDCLCWDGIDEYGTILPAPYQRHRLSPSSMWTKSATTVEPNNSVAVPLDQIESYISSILSATGFKFSSKFLSQFMNQLESKPWSHLALRFLPQAESEALSYLEFDPRPQSIVHIVMLYKGLSDLDDLAWGTSLLSLTEGSDTWKDIVGAEPIDPLADRNAFSAYEITWMEVF